MSKSGYAGCCTILSAAGFLLLMTVGILIQVQPEYMHITKETGSGPVFYSAILYGAFFVGSAIVWYLELQKKAPISRDYMYRYELVPTSSSQSERKPLLA